MDEVLACSKDTLPPGAFTTRQFMTRHNMSRTKAVRILDGRVTSGFLCVKKTLINGRYTNIWWRNPEHVDTS